VNTNSDLIKLIIQSIKNDLASRNPIHVNLALQCIANIGSKEMAEAFGNEIPKLLVSGYSVLTHTHTHTSIAFISYITEIFIQ